MFQKLLNNDIPRWMCCKKKCKSYIKLNDKKNNDINTGEAKRPLINQLQFSSQEADFATYLNCIGFQSSTAIN